MKTTILVMLLFCATTAFCQSYGAVGAVLHNEPMIFEIPDHPLQASARPLATPQYLNESPGSAYAAGVQPLWEFPVREQSVSLGELARRFRQDHLLAKKAEKVFSDQH
ncbi:MAG TPA: hypothetical protein VMT53_19175 [Terriglobales bacterium]|nr:hypothetical protein [Terriglobales bacterium]